MSFVKCQINFQHFFAIITSLRFQVCPLAEHIDLRDHYLAFIELENFGIATDLPDERYSRIVRGEGHKIQVTEFDRSPKNHFGAAF